MNNINLYTYGRSTVEGQWNIDKSRIVNRLYYVNSGTATVLNGTSEHTLTAGNFYIIPQCKEFQPIDAIGFDHTYFDFYSARVFRPDRIISFSGSKFSASAFFEHINSLLDSKPRESIKSVMEQYLSGFMSLIESECKELYFISESSLTYAVSLIHSEYQNITTSSLAKKLNLNKSYFIRLFSSSMGMSPMKYIRAVKVAHGKELMRNGKSVSDAAELCGYSSPSAFYNAVKEELGVPPSKLKE